VARASVDAIEAMVAVDPGIVDKQRAVLYSVHSTCTIRRKRWQLHVNEVSRNRIFESLDAKDDDAPEQHGDVAKEASVFSSASFAPARNNDGEAIPSALGSST
jgi:hypothetical protein